MILSDSTYEQNIFVVWTNAQFRAQYISDVSYQVKFALVKGTFSSQFTGDNYWGKTRIEFTLKSLPPKPLFLDFRGVSVAEYTINGSKQEDATLFTNHKLYFPTAALKEGSNIFEADYGHWAIPLFDQPDIKATWTFQAVVPPEWDVVSNTKEDESFSKNDNALMDEMVGVAKIFSRDLELLKDGKTFKFEESPRISSYLYAIVAGQYKFHEKIQEGFPKMRIYARKSLVDSVNTEEMFKVTQAGMTFYKELFGKEYPFAKYDQVFTPEHNFGAMENVGCVTYNENYLFRGETPSLAKRLRFSITNLHELAHMWFGNLVTMKWWNDLWLNESFATFMSFVAMSQSPELAYFETQWVSFLMYKFWGISEDQLSTTHPITCVINQTSEAETIFDGISYGKGASVLKQLYNIIGRDALKAGLHQYFSKYAWQNTTLPDFVGCINDAFKEQGGNKLLGENFDLIEWCDSWLTTSGVNVVEPIVTYKEDGSIECLKVRQICDFRGQNRLRKQRIDVAIYDNDFNEIIIKDVILSETEEIVSVQVDFTGPVSAILINANDHGYCKVRFDKKSLEAFENHLFRVKNPLSRAMIWRHQWLLVMDKKMSSVQFFNFVIKQIGYEQVDQIVQNGLANLSALIGYYIPSEEVLEKKKQMFETLVNLLANPNLNENNRSPVVDNLFGFIVDTDHTKLAIEWLNSGNVFKAGQADNALFKLSKSHQHSILKIVFKNPDIPKEQKMELLEKTLGDDKSDIAKRVRLTCDAGLPEAENKAKVWKELTDLSSTESIYDRSAKMSGFYSWRQLDLIRPYFDKFYEVLPLIYEKQAFKYLESFESHLLPRMEIKDEHIIKVLSLKLKTADVNSNFSRMLNEAIELLMRSKEVREFAKQN